MRRIHESSGNHRGSKFLLQTYAEEKVSSAVHAKNKWDLLLLLDSYKKLDKEKLKEEEYGQKKYLKSMNITNVRTLFSARASMLITIKANFKGDPRYAATDYMCECGEHQDTQSNLLTCRLYERQREGLDLYNSDAHLVKYYQLVIKERQKDKEKDKGY